MAKYGVAVYGVAKYGETAAPTEYTKTLVANISLTASAISSYVSVLWNKILNKFRLKHYSLRHYDD